MRAPVALSSPTVDSARPGTRSPQLRWWKEVAIIAAFYVLYSAVRNVFGSAGLDIGQEPVESFDNALKVIQLERAVGLFVEPQLQAMVIGWEGFVWVMNVFYGSAHFVVTLGAFVLLYRRAPERFPVWRNTLGFTTAFALIGFSMFPLMPPRLLDDRVSLYGGGRIAVERGLSPIGVEDTMKTVGGLWNFESTALKKISNQYAAMPSLHCAWALWCSMVLYPLVRRRWLRWLVVAHPAVTLYCIMVTGNHYWIDGVGGVAILGVGFLVGRAAAEWTARWRQAGAAHLSGPTPAG
jgi:hypothetical protein